MDVGEHVKGNLVGLCGLRTCHQSDQRCLHSRVDLPTDFRIVGCHVQEDFDCTEYHRGAGMFESVLEQIHYVEHFLFCARLVLGTQVKNDGLAPLVEILDSIQ